MNENSDNSDEDGDNKNTVPVVAVAKAQKSSKIKHKRKDKLFSSSESSEFDSDSNAMTLGTHPKVLADKAIASEISTPAVKTLLGDSPVLRTDKAAISNPPLAFIGTPGLDDTGDDSSSSGSVEQSNIVLVSGNKSVLPNIVHNDTADITSFAVHNDTADITSFAYDETLLVENSRVSVCLYFVFCTDLLVKIRGTISTCPFTNPLLDLCLSCKIFPSKIPSLELVQGILSSF